MGTVDKDLERIFALFECLPLHLLGNVVHDATDPQLPEFWGYSVWFAGLDPQPRRKTKNLTSSEPFNDYSFFLFTHK